MKTFSRSIAVITLLIICRLEAVNITLINQAVIEGKEICYKNNIHYVVSQDALYIIHKNAIRAIESPANEAFHNRVINYDSYERIIKIDKKSINDKDTWYWIKYYNPVYNPTDTLPTVILNTDFYPNILAVQLHKLIYTSANLTYGYRFKQNSSELIVNVAYGSEVPCNTRIDGVWYSGDSKKLSSFITYRKYLKGEPGGGYYGIGIDASQITTKNTVSHKLFSFSDRKAKYEESRYGLVIENGYASSASERVYLDLNIALIPAYREVDFEDKSRFTGFGLFVKAALSIGFTY